MEAFASLQMHLVQRTLAMQSVTIYLCLGLLQVGFLPGGSTTIEEDLSLTYSQKVSLDKFKEAVINKLPHDYMKQDIYLIRWLRAKNFDPAAATEFLMKNVEWRKKNEMDGIMDEDWSDMEEDFPYRLDSYDKEGKPVLIGEFGHWDLRNAEVTGRFQRLNRFGERIMEEQERLIRKLQSEGKQVTRTISIMDMDGFNLAQHTCSRCLSFLLHFYNSFEDHYPGMLDQMFVINNHPLVQTFMQPLLYSFAPATREITHLFNRNRDEYAPVLLKYIDADQLPAKYGGTRKS